MGAKITKVVAGVVMYGDKVLITRRAPKENLAGRWEFPGGKIEDNETLQECLVRELKEELNITVSVNSFCIDTMHDYGDMNINLIAYYCTIVEGEIEISVHDKYKWVEVSDLLSYDLLPADIPIARKIKDEYKKSQGYR